ncbi:hypothetical protein F2Q70_00028734 [Brassica cretica]|uniref:Uncharacterized protein n=1 Tax=Brassica cretica TaxID=69181 RepID=A0A8S9LIM1_BRACR|nr:hypothetical protein F2Q70_00028734 [Brassica cretica]
MGKRHYTLELKRFVCVLASSSKGPTHKRKERKKEQYCVRGRIKVQRKTVLVEVKKKKRVKLGTVKARSISSLLRQTSTSSRVGDVVVATESEIIAPADQFAAYDK